MFALDIAVVQVGSLPDLERGTKGKGRQFWVENKKLITFGEAKKLTAYPMLLAQFLGIVHETKPTFLNQDSTTDTCHPPPVLFTANHLTSGSQGILESFEERNLLIRVVENVTSSARQVSLRKMSPESN